MKWTIDYLDSEGNLNRVWIEAFDKQEAEQKAQHECWDIDTIIGIHK